MSRIAYWVILVSCAATLVPLGCGGEVSSSDVGDSEPPPDSGIVDEGVPDAALDSAAEDQNSSDALPDVVPDSAGCATVTACPSGRGPSMVIVPCLSGGSYCIDSTEVSRAQYSAFLADAFPLTGQPSSCAANTTYEPDPVCEAQPEVTHEGNHPQVCIDWCDAESFCRWAGKRLCAGVWLEEDPQTNEWYNACSAGGVNTYCFGSTWDPDACNGEDQGLGTTAPVGSLPSCQGGFLGLFDMSGNVSEWLNICSETNPPECAYGGGSFVSWEEYMVCVAGTSRPVMHVGSSVGFRCCY
jgi:sulfatase modifying factor 1